MGLGRFGITVISLIVITSCGKISDYQQGFIPEIGVALHAPIKASSFLFFDFNSNQPNLIQLQVQDMLRDNNLHSDLSLRQISKQNNANNLKSIKYEYSLQNIPICSLQTIVHENSNGDADIVSQIPDLQDTSLPEFSTNLVEDINVSKLALEQNLIVTSDFKLTNSETCLSVNEKKLKATRILLVETNELPYQIIVTEGAVTSIEEKFFTASGTTEVYEKNPFDGTIKSFTLSDLSDENNYLENQYFTTTTTGTKAEESDRIYNYDATDGRFDEASAFVHVNEQYNWFVSKGHSWVGNDKLNITVHAVVNNTVNNALYTPANGSSAPKIEVGDGDGSVLQNLPKDSDVTAHELGHHVIYDNLTSTSGESLVLHEGLADYFAFARTGDSCLGESICPAGSSLCAVESQCLRSAANSYVVGVNAPKEAHLKSQFVSGMLWDLRDNEIPADKLDQITYNSTRLLLGSSGYHDFVLTLLIAERSLYQGTYCEAIYQKAKDRGLGPDISDFDCNTEDLNISSRDNSGASITNTESTTETSSSGGLFGCGVATNDSRTSPFSSAWLLFMLLGVPMSLISIKEKLRRS